MARRSTVTLAAPAPKVLAAKAWVAQSGFADLIEVTDTGRLRVYEVEIDPAVLMAMGDEELIDLLTSAAMRNELGDPEEFEP